MASEDHKWQYLLSYNRRGKCGQCLPHKLAGFSDLKEFFLTYATFIRLEIFASVAEFPLPCTLAPSTREGEVRDEGRWEMWGFQKRWVE